ncbi:hypothetical protein FHX48_000760 [Microbacterium halimionae]|uniref:Uncharacterized protein n=1 Tax=Microbacterium halimionae TaxID=1526413 RepID=A0A7W3JMU8_9MICO|nr:hypothetical protein [Microbacterium halimionae]MBA8815708.1 hypothetical protein [Microbacterium halimionae]NII95754.1 hypothetical protein [Microbacterium halimionae]
MAHIRRGLRRTPPHYGAGLAARDPERNHCRSIQTFADGAWRAFASWIVEKVSIDSKDSPAAKSTQADVLQQEVSELKEMIRALRAK